MSNIVSSSSSDLSNTSHPDIHKVELINEDKLTNRELLLAKVKVFDKYLKVNYLEQKKQEIRRATMATQRRRVAQACKVLQKKPKDRTENDIEVVLPFVQEIKLFQGEDRQIEESGEALKMVGY